MRSPGFDERAAGRRVLVIDDDDDGRQALQVMLASHGFVVAGCGNGRDALAWLDGSPEPDIILLDLRMPVMDGWEFRVAQKGEPRFATIPVVALSADGTAQAAAIDADAYVKKPIDHQALLRTLDQLLISTEQREIQTKLAQTDRLTSLGTLAAGVAHELNNPLAYMLLNLDYVMAQMRKVVPAEHEDLFAAVDHVRHGAERIRDIVGGLKTFSRQESESTAPLDVARVLDATLSMVANEIRHRGRLVKEYEPTPPVIANEAKLGQVFLNLLVNAVQALPDRPSEDNEVRVGLRPEGPDRVVVEVRDNGTGIDPQVRGRIFEPFFTTKPVGIGTGLGLAICHGIATSLGGSISVETEVGKGTAFFVELPAARGRAVPASVRPSASPEARPSAGTHGRILIVDDEAIVCASLQRLLSREGETVAETSAREALSQIESGERYDLILCDLLMPVMDGPALYEAIRALDPPQAERMVFMTGGAFTRRAHDFLERVPNPRLGKPFDIDALTTLVRARLSARPD